MKPASLTDAIDLCPKHENINDSLTDRGNLWEMLPPLKYLNVHIIWKNKNRCHIGTSRILAAVPMAAWRNCLQDAFLPLRDVSFFFFIQYFSTFSLCFSLSVMWVFSSIFFLPIFSTFWLCSFLPEMWVFSSILFTPKKFPVNLREKKN